MKRMVINANASYMDYYWYEANPGHWEYWPFDIDEDDLIDAKGGQVVSREVNENDFGDDYWPDDDFKYIADTQVWSGDWGVSYGEPKYFKTLEEAKKYIEKSIM